MMTNYDDLYASLYNQPPTDYSLVPQSNGQGTDWLSKLANPNSIAINANTPPYNPSNLPTSTTEDDWKALLPPVQNTMPSTQPMMPSTQPMSRMAPATGDWAQQRSALMDRLTSHMDGYKGNYEKSKQEIEKVGLQETADRIGALVGGGYIRQADISARYDKKRSDALAQLTKEFDRETAMMVTQLDFGEKVLDAERGDQRFEWDIAAEQRKVAEEMRQAETYEDEKAKKSREKDPTSQESQLAQALATKLNPQLKGQVENMSADQINAMLPTLKGIYEVEERNQQKEEDRKLRAMDMQDRIDDRKARAEMAAQIKDDRALQREVAAQAKIQSDIEKQLPKLSGELQSPQQLLSALGNVESKLGFSLNDYDPKTGLVGGKAVDLPGISVPGLGRTTFYSSDARDLHGAISSVFNQTLKDRSGAAVTNQELERLKGEFNSGKFNTEKEMIGALQDFRGKLALELKNREAGYDPRAVNEYRERGGITSQDVPVRSPATTKTPSGTTHVNAPTPSGKVKVIAPNGTPGYISSSQLNAALAQGYRRAQ